MSRFLGSTKMEEVKAIFLEAIQQPRDRWEDFVQQSSNGSQALVDEVNDLLKAHCDESDSCSMLEGGLDRAVEKIKHFDAGSCEGKTFGNYRLTKLIGRGSNGSVYQAVQSIPVERDVAIKLLNFAESKEALARFELECEVAGKMEHPNIARVYDAGFSDDIGPHLVMELINGQDIVEHCRTSKLSIAERIELVKTVCSAIRYAHQRGCIHRDIKPNNIFIHQIDGQYVAKVIDFGIAKIDPLNLQNPNEAITLDGQFVGSLAYSSPEQIEAVGESIDVRSDIYSIGVILFELLTGELPIAQEELSSAGLSEKIRLLTQADIKAPSKRVLNRDDYAEFSFGSAQQWSSSLKGELDWIVSKCLEKEKSDRYQHVDDLIRDLDSFQAGMPISVGPPTFTYKASRFVRRNKMKVCAAAALLLVSMLGLAGTISGRIHAHEVAIAKEIEEARAMESKEFIESFSKRLLENNVYLFKLLSEEAMTETLRRWDSRDFQSAKAKNTIRLTAAEFYVNVNSFKKATEQIEHIRDDISGLPDSSPEVLKLAYLDALMLNANDKQQSAIEAPTETHQRQKQSLGSSHSDTLLTLETLAVLQQRSGQYESALANLEEVVKLRLETAGKFDNSVSRAKKEIASVYLDMDNQEKAIQTTKETLEARESQIEKYSRKNYELAMRLYDTYKALDNAELKIKYLEKACVNLEGIRFPNGYYRQHLATLHAETGAIDEAIENQTLAIKNFRRTNELEKREVHCEQEIGDATKRLQQYQSQRASQSEQTSTPKPKSDLSNG